MESALSWLILFAPPRPVAMQPLSELIQLNLGAASAPYTKEVKYGFLWLPP